MLFIRQQGSAIITALLVTLLAATIATLLMLQQRIDIRRTHLLKTSDQIYSYAQGMESWAIATLSKNIQAKKMKQLPEPLTVEFNNAEITGLIQDQRSLFNLNCLQNAENQWRLVKLLQILMPGLSAERAQNIAQNITDWMTRDNNADQYYFSLQPPYRAAHRLFAHVSELRLVKDVTANVYQQLLPYVTVLPNSAYKININTASAPILVTLSQGIIGSQTEALIACRNETQGFKDFDAVKNCFNKLNIKLANEATQISYISDYFLVKTYVKLDKQRLSLNTMLYMTNNRSKILWHSYND